MSKRAMLIILDGWGIGPDPERSAIANAKTPVMDRLLQEFPHSTLITYGEDVGLPGGQMGNSEVGHLNIGAGRVVYQDLLRVNNAIKDGSLVENKALQDAIRVAKEGNKKVHLLGLLSDGGVHSHINHLFALTDILDQAGLDQVFIHAFLDGRDTDPKGGATYLNALDQHLDGKSAKVASVIGRYYAMDRDKRWERISKAYNVLVNGEGAKVKDASSAVAKSYEGGVTDEFMEPLVVINDQDTPIATIDSGDVVLFYNFRTDRPRQITQALTQQDFPDEGMKKLDLHFVTMTKYNEDFEGLHIMFTKDNIQMTMGEVLEQAGKTQVRIAETEKYPHVTFFFNGGREEPFNGEDRILVPSPKVATYDLKPEMSAPEVTTSIINAMQQNQPDFICLNYANADMVGHTGDLGAAAKAVEAVDQGVGAILKAGLSLDYQFIIIADHGNSDFMINVDGTPNTAHTKNPVPIILVSNEANGKVLSAGRLADIAPTLLHLMGLTAPEDMTGRSLVFDQTPEYALPHENNTYAS